MAQPALEKFTRRGLAAVDQPVAGTPVAPNPANNGIRLYDGQSGTEFDTLEENRDKPFFSGNEFTTFNHRAFIEGYVHLYPPEVPGDAADGTPECDLLLRIAGMAKTLDDVAGTTRYDPISDSIPMATADFWHAGTLRRIYDARANISALSLEIGNRARAQLRVQGQYTAINEQALPAITVSETFGPVIEAANSITQVVQYPDGVAGAALNLWGKALTVDFGSQLTSKEYTEHEETAIDGRQPTFTLRIARPAKADFDPWAVRKAGTYITATLQVANADGRYTLLGIRGLIRDINETDIDGDYGLEITGPCIATSAGGDEFYIEFGTNP
jgi:hypothetical protein